MHKTAILWLLAGWLVSLVFPPQALLGMFQGAKASA